MTGQSGRFTHRPELDGLRGLAIIAVVAQHAGFRQSGGAGVTAFFVLSGYLITSLLLHEQRQFGGVNLRAFYWRRVARLGPALPPALAVATLVGWAQVGSDHTIVGLLSTVFYVANLAVTKLGSLAFPAFTWAWSLSLEEQFYLLWPALLLAVGSRRCRRALPVLIAVVMVARGFAAWGDPHAAYFAPWYRIDALMLGCLIAIAPRKLPAWVGLLAMALLVWSAAMSYRQMLAVGLTFAALATAALILTGSMLTTGLLRSAPLRHVGLISYSLYIWNGVLVGLDVQKHIGAAGLVLLSLALAETSTYGLERPARKYIAGRGRLRAGGRLPLLGCDPGFDHRAA